MKSTLLITATTFLCLGSVVSAVVPAWADTLPVVDENSLMESEEASQPSTPTADLLIVDPIGLESLTDQNEDDLNAVANRINQVIESDSDEFLPEGMVVRGTAGSLQLGSEL